MKLSDAHLEQHLQARLRMLVRSAEAYDQGDYFEALRLATSIETLIGDRYDKNGKAKENAVSLATRLKKRPDAMIDSAWRFQHDEMNLHGPFCRLGLQIQNAKGFLPIVDGYKGDGIGFKRSPFDAWWKAPILRDCYGQVFSRKDIVRTMRDKEDAHADDSLDPKYGEIAYGEALGIRQGVVGGQVFDENPATVAVRQIAHEVLRSFEYDFPLKYLDNDLKTQPEAFLEFATVDAKGGKNSVADPGEIEIIVETTSSPIVRYMWQKRGQGADVQLPPSKFKTEWSNRFAVRVVLVMWAPNAFRVNETYVGDGPGRAIIRLVFEE